MGVALQDGDVVALAQKIVSKAEGCYAVLDAVGRELQITEVGMADELAAAASALMVQGAEGTPVILIRGVAWPRREGNARELQRPLEKDLFR
jgi:F420-0:gamma-glutamyl ligase